jgi:hypothetical protein
MISVLDALHRFRTAPQSGLKQFVFLGRCCSLRDFVREQGLSWPVCSSGSKTALGHALWIRPCDQRPTTEPVELSGQLKQSEQRMGAGCVSEPN